MLETVTVSKLVHGGQAMGTLADGRTVFVWGALPGETITVELKKSKRSFAEGIAREVIKPAPERIEPVDEAYLSTSPWQIMTWQAENRYKNEILAETFAREKVNISNPDFYVGEQQFRYRSKMEYSFWADDDGLHLALFHRGTHGKQIVQGSSIARPEIDQAAQKILAILNSHKVRGSQLKTIVLRCNQAGDAVGALFVKDENFPAIAELSTVCKGLTICYSTPKSPASVLTKTLQTYGDITLTDNVLGNSLIYDVHSFFQVNLPVFETAVKRIDYWLGGANNIVDMYSGVGSIGLSIGGTKTLVELDHQNILYAQKNADGREIDVIEASTENAVDYITPDSIPIFDPPRAGLHKKVIDCLLEVQPRTIVYLSCNPITQARDVALLQTAYTVKHIEGYNFFPRTPHIESLILLELTKPRKM